MGDQVTPLTELQRSYFHELRKPWSQRWWYTARRAFDLARRAQPFAVSRETFWQRVRFW